MIRLRWIILVGCTAISAVTAATLGAIFQQQKQKQQENANNPNNPNNHHGGLPCCTCAQMRDEATWLGKSLDEFFEKNPGLNRDDCNGDTCAKDYTSIVIPNILGGSQSTFCRTAAGVDVTVTQTKTDVVIVPPSSPMTDFPVKNTAAKTDRPGNGFIASVVNPTRGGTPTTETPDGETPPQSTEVAPSLPASPGVNASPSDDETSTQERPPTTEVIDTEAPQSTNVAASSPTDVVVTASPSDAESQHPTSPPESSDDTTIGSPEPSPSVTSKSGVRLPINMPIDPTDESPHTTPTITQEEPTRTVVSGSFTVPVITTVGSDQRTLDSSYPTSPGPVSSLYEVSSIISGETTGTTDSVAGSTESPATSSRKGVHLPINMPIDPDDSPITTSSTKDTSRIVISGGFTVPSITTETKHRTPDSSSPKTTTWDTQASETSGSSAATSKTRVHVPINMPIDTDESPITTPSTETPTRIVISGAFTVPSITTGSDQRTTTDFSSQGTRTSDNQASETPATTSKASMHHLPIGDPLPEEPITETPTRTDVSGSEFTSSTTTVRDHTPGPSSSETRTSETQASETTPESSATRTSSKSHIHLPILHPLPTEPTTTKEEEPTSRTEISGSEGPSSTTTTSSSAIAGALSDFPSETPISTSTFSETLSTYPPDDITTTTPHSAITAHPVTTGKALSKTSESPQQESSGVLLSHKISSISGIMTMISSMPTTTDGPPTSTSIIPDGYPTSPPVQEPAADEPVPPTSDPTNQASSSFPLSEPTSITSVTSHQEYSTSSPLDGATASTTTTAAASAPVEEGVSSTRSAQAPPVTSPTRSGFTTSTTIATTPAPTTSTAGPTTTTTPYSTCRPEESGTCSSDDHNTNIHSYVQTSLPPYYSGSPPDT
ncbi:hypothetical protein PG984_010192 [Apiospora sp. TS-2023a]